MLYPSTKIVSQGKHRETIGLQCRSFWRLSFVFPLCNILCHLPPQSHPQSHPLLIWIHLFLFQYKIIICPSPPMPMSTTALSPFLQISPQAVCHRKRIYGKSEHKPIYHIRPTDIRPTTCADYHTFNSITGSKGRHTVVSNANNGRRSCLTCLYAIWTQIDCVWRDSVVYCFRYIFISLILLESYQRSEKKIDKMNLSLLLLTLEARLVPHRVKKESHLH